MDKTVVKAFAVLEALGRSSGDRGVTELAHELGLGISNAHRLLTTLVKLGYVRRSEREGKYELTLKAWEVGVSLLRRTDLRAAARRHLQWLGDMTGETVHLAIQDGCDVIYVDRIEADQPIRADVMIGQRIRAYCIASGKAMLAELKDELVCSLFPELTPYTSRTISSRELLLSELAKVRRQGFATCSGEWRPEICCAGAVLKNDRKMVVGALGISSPVQRLPPVKLRRISAKYVVEAARRTSAELGYR